MIKVGQKVHFKAGYGQLSEDGICVGIDRASTPTQQIDFETGRLVDMPSIVASIVTDSGRYIRGLRFINMPGVGIDTYDIFVDENVVTEYLKRAYDYEEEQKKERHREIAERIARDKSRVITDRPVFFYNGIKDRRGEKLQKAYYSKNEELITIYQEGYSSFSGLVHKCFDVINETDIMVDYFEKDRFYVYPEHPLYNDVLTAFEKQEERRLRLRQR